MATATDTRQRALMYLKTLELMVNDLPEVAQEWGELSDGERESWSLDWGNEMAGLGRLAQYVADGALDAGERARYRRVLRKLKDALPIVERLDLRRPPIPLEA